MPGPRIYTEAWEKLKVAAKETEARETTTGPRPIACTPEKRRHLRAPRLSVIVIAVLAVVTIATASLWMASQTQLMTATGDVTDFKTRLALLQENMKKMENEKQHLEEENRTLSMQYEQRAAELTQMEEELNVLRSQKEKPKPKQRQTATTVENPAVNLHNGSRTAEEPIVPAPSQERGHGLQPQKQEQQAVKVYKID